MPEELATKSDIAAVLARLERFETLLLERIEQVGVDAGRNSALLLERIERVGVDAHERTERTETLLLKRIDDVEQSAYERIERVETTLLKEFRKWAISFESKFRANEALVVGFSERVTSLEERVSELEQK